jgi:glutamate synthase domain-containing protein 2
LKQTLNNQIVNPLKPYLRYSTWFVMVVLALLAVMLWMAKAISGLWPLLFVGLSLLGLYDFLQTRHAITRNYPVIGHLRFLFEEIRPEIRQYFLESDTDGRPFSRQQRALVYQRAKQEPDKLPFGTQQDAYATGFEWINHSVQPAPVQGHDFRLTIGGPDCTQPYSASVFNISAMSFGALSANAIQALNKGALKGHFAHDTGEGSISTYHRQHGGDLIWEIGSGYFGCRDAQGHFSEEAFIQNARDPQVKMIELKLSQGAKPGHGGVLPGPKVTAEIAAARGVPQGLDCVSPASHAAFSTPIELLQFIARLRTLSGGKPTGFKLAIGHPWEWFAIVKAMLKTGITPDFIVVDGKEGGTGAAPVEFIDHVGVPMREGLLLVHNTLVGVNLRDKIKIGAAGKIVSAFDVVRTMALGADWCNSARGFMFALGCIQAQSCHTGTCPTGVTTQDPQRQQALVVPDKAERVFNFHKNTLKALAELIAAAGLTHPNQLRAYHLVKRVSDNEIRLASNLYPFLKPGELLDDKPDPAVFKLFWPKASAESFQPLG